MDWTAIFNEIAEKERPRTAVCLGDSWSHLWFSVEGDWQAISGGLGGPRQCGWSVRGQASDNEGGEGELMLQRSGRKGLCRSSAPAHLSRSLL